MMNRQFLLFPDFKDKAVTLSYDDGVRQDKRLIAVMQKNGLRGTFNINSGLFNANLDHETKGRMTKEEALQLYTSTNQEVAVHGHKHWSLAKIDEAMAAYDVIVDRKELEQLFGKVVKGMAYANGSCNDKVVEVLKKCGISYARTVTSTEKFDLPTDWLQWDATCHHNNPHLMEIAKQFLEGEKSRHFWFNGARLFYLWGHSYEFDNNDNWPVIEEFAAYIGNRENVWYATNGEIYQYVQAYDRLEFAVDGSKVYNPSALDVFIDCRDRKYVIPAGKTVDITMG